jgi:predicted adenine nucleotide alpha hydrolase (AANH) superfamily ATPase
MDDFFRRSDKKGIKMDKEINQNVKIPKKMLLHVCCAPCSSHVLSVLYDAYDITAFFYNPNITEKAEYEKRIEELKRFTQEAEFARNVVVCDGVYEPEKFYAIAKGLEKEPERGRRCYKCYELRPGMRRSTVSIFLRRHFRLVRTKTRHG